MADGSAAVAREHALTVLRRKVEAGQSREAIVSTALEGSCGPGALGYEMRPGQITVPWPGAGSAHTFRTAALLDEIESPQGGLF